MVFAKNQVSQDNFFEKCIFRTPSLRCPPVFGLVECQDPPELVSSQVWGVCQATPCQWFSLEVDSQVQASACQALHPCLPSFLSWRGWDGQGRYWLHELKMKSLDFACFVSRKYLTSSCIIYSIMVAMLISKEHG